MISPYKDLATPVAVLLVAGLSLLAAGCADVNVPDNPFDYGDESGGADGFGESDGSGGAGDSAGAEEDTDTDESGDPRLDLGEASEAGVEAGVEAGESAGDDSGDACLEFSDALAPVSPSVLFVLDRSGSMMTDGFDLDDPDKSRWQALYESVEHVLLDDELAAQIEVGAKTFSTKGWGECGVSPTLDVDFGLDNGAEVLDTIPGPQETVTGGTPTLATMTTALDYMRDYSAEGAKVIVLITDGAIGCTEDQSAALAEIVADLEDAREVDEISTYVIGIDPTYNSFEQQLHAMAVAGGSEDYIEAANATSLSDALTQVVASSYANSCHLRLDQAPGWPELTEVEAGGQLWPELQGCDEGDGWMWTNEELTRMRMCNAACDALLATGEVEVRFFCEPG